MLCHWEDGRTVAGKRKLTVTLEEMPTSHGSQKDRARTSLQEHGRVDNPFRESRGLSHNAPVVPFLSGSISTIR